DIEGAVRYFLGRIGFYEGEIRRIYVGSRLRQSPLVAVEPHDPSVRPGVRNRASDRAIPAAHVDHPFAYPDAVDEEFVIAGQAMLGVHATPVRECALVDDELEIVLDGEQASQRAAGIASSRFEDEQGF